MGVIQNKKGKVRTIDQSCRSRANRQGVTLVELLVSIFIFSLVMITVVSLFTRFVTFQKRSQAVQRNMEDARYAMELMAKTLRTSSVVASPPGSIKIYDYSQQKCINYSFVSPKIRSVSDPAADKAACAAIVTFSTAPRDMVGNSINNMTFVVVPSTLSPSHVGQVTISMVICSNITCSGTENDRAALQTTVSLRDYQESNP